MDEHPTADLSKFIAISDDVYRRLERKKGDRSCSEVVADCLDAGNRLADVAGQGVLDGETVTSVKQDIGRSSEGTLGSIDDESS